MERRGTLEQPEDYKLIPLGKGINALIDNDLYEIISKGVWRRSSNGYAVRGPESTRLHRLVMSLTLGRDLKRDELIDHVNRVRLDCRVRNLRIATPSENMANQLARSGFKGVQFDRATGKWAVRLAHVYIGEFKDQIDAAYVYDQCALQMWGTFARLNVLDG